MIEGPDTGLTGTGFIGDSPDPRFDEEILVCRLSEHKEMTDSRNEWKSKAIAFAQDASIAISDLKQTLDEVRRDVASLRAQLEVTIGKI